MAENDEIRPSAENDNRIGQVARVLALLFNAAYPGCDMWRYKITCEMVARGAVAEANDGEEDVSSQAWLAAAVKILMMESKHGVSEWYAFSPHAQAEIAKAFLPSAKALVDWVNAIRRMNAEDQECDWQEIAFMCDAPEGVILEKLGGYESGPNEELIRQLLFTENHRCEITYNPLFFRQLEHGLMISGEDIDYDEPYDKNDIQECNAIIRSLYEYRAKYAELEGETIPTLAEKSLQEIIEDLSASNEPHFERILQDSVASLRKNEEKFVELGTDTSIVCDGQAIVSLKEPMAQRVTITTPHMSASCSIRTNLHPETMQENTMYDVFICHATEDKGSFVNELVEELRRRDIKVWVDDLKIKWGDPLRKSIDEGLKKSRFGIVVISKHFIAKGWTQYELDGLFEKEMLGGKVILPIWHEITKKEVQAFSLTLAGRKAMTTASVTPADIADELVSLLAEEREQFNDTGNPT